MFTIEVRNTGNVALRNISISDPLAPGCDRTISSLGAGKRSTYSCGAPDVEAEFTNTATVRARDGEGTRVSDSDTARVEVENPNIQIVISPPAQTLLKGDTARFSIFVVNTSRTVSLTDVEVVDPLVPDCNRNIGNLPKGEERIYSCTVENVAKPLINQISVSARNIFTGEMVQDSTSSLVAVLDMQVKLSIKPSVVPMPGGPVQFIIEVLNSGSVPFEIDRLSVDPLGSILDPANRALKDNSCLQANEAAIVVGQRYSCSFTAAAEGNPGTRSYRLEARAQDADGKRVFASADSDVFIVNDAEFATTIKVLPAGLPAPGGEVIESIVITNGAPNGDVDVTFLHHSTLGNLDQIGSCLLPQRIAAGDTYRCEFKLTISGPIGTVIDHTISAAGIDNNGDYVGDVDSAEIVLFDPSRQNIWLPLVAGSR